MRSTTIRILRGLIPTERAIARASIFLSPLAPLARLGALVDKLAAMALEGARGGELAELVPDHVLGEVHRDELVAVVHGQRVSDELRRDGRGARPGLEDPPLVALVHLPDLLQEAVLYERPLLQTPRHSDVLRS